MRIGFGVVIIILASSLVTFLIFGKGIDDSPKSAFFIGLNQLYFWPLCFLFGSVITILRHLVSLERLQVLCLLVSLLLGAHTFWQCYSEIRG